MDRLPKAFDRIVFRLIPYLVAGFLVMVRVTAQPGFQEERIQIQLANKLPVDNQNWEISQNPVNGFVYFANSSGLIEYNGLTARLFTMPFNQGVRSVYVNAQGIIFTGSFEDFGYWEADGLGGLRYHSLASDTQVAKNDEIWNIFELSGALYFQSFTTIYAYKQGRVQPIQGPAVMLFMFRAGENFIVQALGKGLFRFDGKDFEHLPGSEQFGSLKVHALIELPGNELWICTANNGIYRYDQQRFTQEDTEISRYLRHQTCNAGLAMNDSLFVFGTILNGLVMCDQQGVIKKVFNYANGLQNNTVLSLFRDNRQGLWIGLDEGANYINTASPFRLYADRNGMLGTIYSVFRRNDLLYLGTNHGLFVADISLTRGEYSFSNLRLIPGSQGQVWQLFGSGDQIVCGHNEGTFLVYPNALRKISAVTGGWSFTPYQDFLLQGNYTGIVVFYQDKTGNLVFRNRVEGFYEPTRFIEVDYQGYVWAIHPQKGIYRLELNENMDSVRNILHIDTIAGTAGKIRMSKINNQVVFMTSGNIYSFDYENKTFYPLRSLATGLDEYIGATQIMHHEKNNYWFMLENKIALFDISKSLEAVKITELVQKYTDLPGREQQIFPLDRNTMLIPTRKAFTTWSLTLRTDPEIAPAPVIARMIFAGKANSTVILPGRTKSAAVPSYQNNLTVYLADPSRFDHDDKEYLYRIPEIDNTWHRTKLDNFSFLNLVHGAYHLQVRSMAGEAMAETIFTIMRPWYLSAGALAFYLLALAGLTVAGVKVFRLELNRHRQLIEYEVRKNKLESELDYKSYELMLTMRYLIRKTDILQDLQKHIQAMKTDASKYPVKTVKEMEHIINTGLDTQTEEWKSTMNNLKLSQEGYFRKLKEKFPVLTPHDLRLCSYLRMNFTTKEISRLLNISGRSVEIGRYRLRKKLNLDHNTNLTEFLINESETMGNSGGIKA